jgi:hypothetical protein
MAFKYGSNSSLSGGDALVRGIGLFSLGLGVAELVAPGKIARTFGLEGKENLLRAYGLREIGAGIGTLSTDPVPALWARVGGDVLDMATLAFGANRGDEPAKKNAMMGIAAVAGIAALDAFAATLMKKRGGERPPPADFSDRSGLPMGVEASRGYYRQRKTTGPAVAHHDVREDRTHSGERSGDGRGAGGSNPSTSTSPADAGRPEITETDLGQSPIPSGVALS